MCGRTKLTPIDKSVAEQLKLKEHDRFIASVQGIDWEKQGVVSINQRVPLITQAREVHVMRWGMPMEFASHAANMHWARKETLFTQQLFAAHALRRRAIMLVDGWWERGRYISVGHPVAIATIWAAAPVAGFGDCFAMVTQEAMGNVALIHERMPAIVDPDRWLDHKQLSEWIGTAQIEQAATV